MPPRLLLAATTSLSFDQRMQRAASALSGVGYEVLLIGRQLPGAPPLDQKPYEQYRLQLKHLAGARFYASFNWQLFLYLMRQRAQLIYAADADSLPACWLAAKLKGVPLVFDAHEYFSQVPELVHRPLVQRVWNLIERAFTAGADACITVSGTLAEVMSQTFSRHFHTIRNVPVLGAPVQASSPPGVTGSYMIYSGALNKGRGIELLFAASQPHWPTLVLCGQGDLEEELKAQATSTGPAAPKCPVVFAGNVSPELLKQYVAGAVLGFNLLENLGLSYYYSAANKFFDYVAAGVPQVCIDFPEYQALNRQHEVALLVPHDVSAVQTAVDAVLLNNEIYQSLQNNCKKAQEDWNWNQESYKLVSIVSSLL